MDMVTALFQTLHAGLVLWNTIESKKDLDELQSLREQYYEEYNKDLSMRSDAILDNILLKLRILCDKFAAGVRTKNAAPQS